MSVTPIEVNKVNKTANEPVVAVTAVQLIEIARELSDLAFLGIEKPKFLNQAGTDYGRLSASNSKAQRIALLVAILISKLQVFGSIKG